MPIFDQICQKEIYCVNNLAKPDISKQRIRKRIYDEWKRIKIKRVYVLDKMSIMQKNYYS